MKTFYSIVIAAGILAQPALAQGGLEEKLEEGLGKLKEGLRFTRFCADDVWKFCRDVLPGRGRLTACLKEKEAQLSPDCLQQLRASGALEQGPIKIALKPGPVEGETLNLPNARDYAYCEIVPFVAAQGKVTAEFYNTSGTTGDGGGCPADRFAALDGKKLADQIGATVLYLNPNPQTARRHWVMDQLTVSKAGETVDFSGVKATWVASMAPEQLQGMAKNNYEPGEIRRDTKYLYAKGSPVFLMRTPDGKTYVMQSYATEVDPSLAYGQLPQLGGKLKLPQGWKFEVKTLGEELTIEPGKAGDVAHIIRDDLHNVYEGCGFDAACNYTP